MKEWYYAMGRQQIGPVAKSVLMELRAAGTLDGNSLVWSGGMADWLPISQVAELALRPPPLPPPPAPVALPQTPLPQTPIPSIPQLSPLDQMRGASPPLPAPGPGAEDIEGYKVLAIMAYFPPLFLIPLLFYRGVPYVRFHLNQGLILMILWALLLLLGHYVDLAIRALPLRWHSLGGLVSMIEMVPVAYMILGITNSAQGRMTRLPLPGTWRML